MNCPRADEPQPPHPHPADPQRQVPSAAARKNTTPAAPPMVDLASANHSSAGPLPGGGSCGPRSVALSKGRQPGSTGACGGRGSPVMRSGLGSGRVGVLMSISQAATPWRGPHKGATTGVWCGSTGSVAYSIGAHSCVTAATRARSGPQGRRGDCTDCRSGSTVAMGFGVAEGVLASMRCGVGGARRP